MTQQEDLWEILQSCIQRSHPSLLCVYVPGKVTYACVQCSWGWSCRQLVANCWVLGNELKSTARAVHTLNHWPISPSTPITPKYYFWMPKWSSCVVSAFLTSAKELCFQRWHYNGKLYSPLKLYYFYEDINTNSMVTWHLHLFPSSIVMSVSQAS